MRRGPLPRSPFSLSPTILKSVTETASGICSIILQMSTWDANVHEVAHFCSGNINTFQVNKNKD